MPTREAESGRFVRASPFGPDDELDLHLVTERRCHAAIEYLAERLPLGCQLALATRTDPPLPLASLRVHARLAELRASELSLGEAEAGSWPPRCISPMLE